MSLKGKTTVFNSLIISLLQYVTANTTTPKRVIQEVKEMARGFLWSGKQSKVAYDTVIQLIRDGGLRLADLECRIKASLLSWVRRTLLSPESSAAETLRLCTQEKDLNLILGAKRHYPKEIIQQSPFYGDMLRVWEELHNFPPSNEEDIRSEIIWYNHHVESPRNPFNREQWNRWIAAGIMIVNDVCMPEQGRLMGQLELEDKYHLHTNFLQNLSFRNSLPFHWKQALTREFSGNPRVKFEIRVQNETIDILNSPPKKWYGALLSTKKQEIKRKESWRQDLSLTQERPLLIDWERTFMIPYSVTRETKMHSFQFRISHRLITCNKYLHKIKLRENATCSFCGGEDNIVHFLIECPPVKRFWTDIDDWCTNHINISIADLTTAEKILGFLSDTNNNNVERIQNWIVLIAKYYIHREKLFNQGRLSVLAFLREAKKKLYTEFLACQLEGKPRKFRKFVRFYQALGGQATTPTGD